MKGELNAVLTASIDNCFEQGLFKKVALSDYVIEVPNNPDHGHFATNLPLTLASSQKRPPREIAAAIIEHLKDAKHVVERVEVAGPGFINFWISFLY